MRRPRSQRAAAATPPVVTPPDRVCGEVRTALRAYETADGACIRGGGRLVTAARPWSRRTPLGGRFGRR